MKNRSNKTLIATAIGMVFTSSTAFAIDTTGHSLELKTRLVQFDVDVDKTTTTGDFRQLALGNQLEYKSPYFSDFIGIDASLFQVNKLGESSVQKNEMLPNDTADSTKVVNSWSQMGQAYMKLKHGDLVEAKIGRQLHNSLLLKSTNSRAVPDTFSGYSFSVRPTSEIKVYGSVYDSWLPRSGDKFQKFGTEVPVDSTNNKGVTKNIIDTVTIYGTQYINGPIQIDFESLNSKNYLQKYGLMGSYTFTLANKETLKLTAGISTTADDGSLFTCAAEKELDYPTGTTNCKNDGKGKFLDLEWKTGSWTIGGAIAKFNGLWIEDNFAASNVSRKGSLIQDHGSNFFPTASTSGNDMTNNGELARMVRATYDWNKYVNGLKTAVKYKLGTGATNNYQASLGSGRESEREYDIIYATPSIKGLTFRYNYLKYEAHVTGTIKAITEGGSKAFREDHRIYVDYTYRFF
ncbi:porin [Limnohabitans sp. MORI2]|uniref:OprD family outer membrane porin n=1 Tax=Limnohabitans sp. MORI2 TaxID=1751150 RepID=UPI00237740F1|nr:OprD family outer membrane porin [Limnohabitans sp. MORI2]BDU58182.1 porin [Limnohabitans sp. MORI2]